MINSTDRELSRLLMADKYVGGFKDGKRNGQGTFAFANGGKYLGEFKDARFNGQGNFTFPDGRKYVGEFKDDTYATVKELKRMLMVQLSVGYGKIT